MHDIRRFVWLTLLSIFTLTLASTGFAGKAKQVKFTVKLVCDFENARQAGNYDWEHMAYGSATPPAVSCKKDESVRVRLYQIDDEVVTLKEMAKRVGEDNCQLATWPVLLAIGAQFPEMQRDKHIVAAGSVWHYSPKSDDLKSQGHRMVSYLDADKIDGRNLGFDQAYALPHTAYYAATCSK